VAKFKKILLINAVAVLLSLNIYAQDAEFSQFYAAPLHLNSALAGISYGPRVNLNYRNQWPNIDKGYVTYAASYDQHFDKIRGGVGLAFNADRIAGGVIQNYSVQAMYAYQLAFSHKFGLKLAVSGGILSRQLDWNKLTFQDQIDPIYGFSDASGIPNPTSEAVPQQTNLLMPDFGAGFLAFTPKFYAGVGVKHLNVPKQSFYNDKDNRLPMRFAIHGGYVIDLTPKKKKDDIYLAPNILLVQQSNFSQLNVGTYFNYNFIYAGAFYRNTIRNSDAVIALLGFKIQYVRIAYSFDFTMSKLSLNSGGAHELSLTFNWGGDNNSLSPKGRSTALSCPRILNF
jgi:type IX secretion system PorP/SprF family membrane protein